MNKKIIAIFAIFFILLVILGVTTIYKLHQLSMQEYLTQETVETFSEENDDLEKVFSSLLENETLENQTPKRIMYSLFIQEKTDTQNLLPESYGNIYLFRDDYFKNPSNFSNLNVLDFWKNSLSSIDDYSEFDIVDELDSLKEDDLIIIQTTTCSNNFSALYSQVLNLKINKRLNIIILSSYESTDLHMAEQYGRYIDDFLAHSLENSATIRVLYTDGFEQTYEYNIR